MDAPTFDAPGWGLRETWCRTSPPAYSLPCVTHEVPPAFARVTRQGDPQGSAQELSWPAPLPGVPSFLPPVDPPLTLPHPLTGVRENVIWGRVICRDYVRDLLTCGFVLRVICSRPP